MLYFKLSNGLVDFLISFVPEIIFSFHMLLSILKNLGSFDQLKNLTYRKINRLMIHGTDVEPNGRGMHALLLARLLFRWFLGVIFKDNTRQFASCW